MTNFLLLIGAGLFSKAVGDFQRNAFNKLLGSDVDDAGGDGPGSYDVRGAIWHLDCCNPENNTDGTGWGIFNARKSYLPSYHFLVGEALTRDSLWLAKLCYLRLGHFV